MAADISSVEGKIHKNHVAALSGKLTPGERVIDAVGCGELKGRLPALGDSLVLTSERILIIHDKGFRRVVDRIADIKLKEVSDVDFSDRGHGYYAAVTIHSRVGLYRIGVVGTYEEQAAWPRKILDQVHAVESDASRVMPAAGDVTARLRKLQELLDAGLLMQDEYEMKRAEIVNSI
jgi:hypothetical protein